MKDLRRVLAFLSLLLTSACGSPITNSAESRLVPRAASSVEKNPGSQNLLETYGCPNAFPNLPLCMRIEWNDDLGRPTDGPIYWKFYRLHAMSARLLFWSANDGWPIDPREEFLQVKFIQLKLFMPAMGHASMGLYPHVEAVLGRVGQFKVTNIHFVMLADTNNPWEVRIQLKTSHDDPDFDTANDSHIFSQAVLRFTQLERR